MQNPPQWVVFDIDSSLAAVPIEFFGLCRKLARIRSTSSSAVNGRPLDFCLHRHPVSGNCLYHARMVLSVGGSFAYFALNARSTVTTDLVVWYSNTQNDFSRAAGIFSLHTLASPSGWNVNYDETQFTGKKISICTGFVNMCPRVIINFRNPGVPYETPCIPFKKCISVQLIHVSEWWPSLNRELNLQAPYNEFLTSKANTFSSTLPPS